MGKLKCFFKHKFVIVSIAFLLIGGLTFGALKIIPKSKRYQSVNEMTMTDYINNTEVTCNVVVTFKGDRIITTNEFSDGRKQEVSQQSYEIIDKVLYVEGRKWGEIDACRIHIPSSIIINGKAADIGYYSPIARTAKYISYGLLGLGGAMFIIAVYIAITKKKKS